MGRSWNPNLMITMDHLAEVHLWCLDANVEMWPVDLTLSDGSSSSS